MEITRRHFLAVTGLGLGSAALPREAYPSEPNDEPVSKPLPPQRNNKPTISNDPRTPLGIIGLALASVAVLVTPGIIIDRAADKRVREAFQRADGAEQNRAKRRRHLQELNEWNSNQVSTC